MPECCVISRLKMLEYYRVCSTFKSAYALPSGMIRDFKISLNSNNKRAISS